LHLLSVFPGAGEGEGRIDQSEAPFGALFHGFAVYGEDKAGVLWYVEGTKQEE
jgi:hypothetical protein